MSLSQGVCFASFCPAQVCEACEHVHDTLDALSELGGSFLPGAAVCECLRYFTAIAHRPFQATRLAAVKVGTLWLASL